MDYCKNGHLVKDKNVGCAKCAAKERALIAAAGEQCPDCQPYDCVCRDCRCGKGPGHYEACV